MSRSPNGKLHPDEKPELFDRSSSIFQYSPGVYDLAERLFELNRQIMTLSAERLAVEKELLELRGASTSDAYVKLSLLTMIMRRDLRLDPTHPALEALRGITEALDNVHIKVSPSALPEEGERH